MSQLENTLKNKNKKIKKMIQQKIFPLTVLNQAMLSNKKWKIIKWNYKHSIIQLKKSKNKWVKLSKKTIIKSKKNQIFIIMIDLDQKPMRTSHK